MVEQNQTQQGGQSKACTENNNGIDLPENMDASQHSGDAEVAESHAHEHGKWKRGMLPGQKYIKICQLPKDDGTLCGHHETIDINEWMRYA